ncbi:MAG: hypothetical protein ACE37K_18795 [Planctomycetota bacterium]
MKIHSLLCSLLLSVAVLAQEDAAATKAAPASDLQKVLRAAALGDGAVFDVTWSWPITFVGSATTSRSGGSGKEQLGGRFDRDAIAVDYDAGRLGKISIVQVGRHTMLRDGDGPWRLDNLSGARALGLSFLPDPQRMLLSLAAAAPRPTIREIVEVDDRAVERVGMTLDKEQLTTLVRAGAIHDPSPGGAVQQALRMAGRGRPRGNAEVVPVDVVVDIDVETRNVTRVAFRAITKERDFRAAMRRMRQRGGGVVQEQGRADEPEQPQEERKQGPMKYEGGMPVRAKDGKTVYSIELKFSQHGKQSAVRLGDAQQRLLGR